jgi:hypothetical protein
MRNRYALSLGKQVLPILRRRPAPGWQPPRDRDDLARVFGLQWIFFDHDAAFQASLGELITAIDNDLATSTYYAWLLDRAAERNRPRPDRGPLLRGRALKRARAFVPSMDRAGRHRTRTSTSRPAAAGSTCG